MCCRGLFLLLDIVSRGDWDVGLDATFHEPFSKRVDYLCRPGANDSHACLLCDCLSFVLVLLGEFPLSHVFRRANDLAAHLCPVYAGVHGLVYQAADDNIVASNHVQAMRCFRTRLRVVLWSNYTLNGVFENEVGDLVTGYKRAHQ
jgi:hypothetical protein